MKPPRELTEEEVTFTLTIEPETLPVEGNASAWGDGTDERYWQEIRDRLERGDTWAWCVVTVTAEWSGITGSDSLGGCCYDSEAEFRKPGGYFDDMKTRALDELNQRIYQEWTRVARLTD